MSEAEPREPRGQPEATAALSTSLSRTDPKVLELLVCPITRTGLIYDASRQELISRAAGLAYPIRNGVPMMTADAARTLDEEPSASHR